MMLTENELYSFNVDLENILSIPYSIITSVSGLDNSENIIDFLNINLKNQKNNILIAYENSICFYNLNIIENVSVNLEKLNYEITLNNFNVTKINSCDTSFAVISNSKQAAKIYNLENSFNDGFSEKEVKNEEITPHFYSSSMFKYVKTTQETELIDSPYSKNSTITILGQTNLVIVGEGQYLDNTPIIGWEYVMFTNNGQNYYGYVDSLSLTNLESSSYSKNYVTCLAHTKLYSLPSIFLDSINKELKSIIGSSRLEIIDTICDYSSQNVSYVLVKVNGETIGFIDKSRIIKTTGVNEKIIPNATIMRNNSEIFTSTTNDKEIIIRLNKGDRVKVIGKRDTVTNYTKVSFNDSEGNEYTGYVYTHNLEPDSWSMLQIIGMLLVVLNVILLIIIICIKNKVTR